jgi:hypothetical protein
LAERKFSPKGVLAQTKFFGPMMSRAVRIGRALSQQWLKVKVKNYLSIGD